MSAASETPATEGSRRCLQVLIVDDDPEICVSLAELIRTFGHRVQTALDGREALRQLRHDRFHLVLLDIGLPDMNGFDVARRLTLLGERNMSIVALTGYGRDDDQRTAGGAGFDDYVVKPCGLERLSAILERAQALVR